MKPTTSHIYDILSLEDSISKKTQKTKPPQPSSFLIKDFHIAMIIETDFSN